MQPSFFSVQLKKYNRKFKLYNQNTVLQDICSVGHFLKDPLFLHASNQQYDQAHEVCKKKIKK